MNAKIKIAKKSQMQVEDKSSFRVTLTINQLEVNAGWECAKSLAATIVFYKSIVWGLSFRTSIYSEIEGGQKVVEALKTAA